MSVYFNLFLNMAEMQVKLLKKMPDYWKSRKSSIENPDPIKLRTKLYCCNNVHVKVDTFI